MLSDLLETSVADAEYLRAKAQGKQSARSEIRLDLKAYEEIRASGWETQHGWGRSTKIATIIASNLGAKLFQQFLEVKADLLSAARVECLRRIVRFQTAQPSDRCHLARKLVARYLVPKEGTGRPVEAPRDVVADIVEEVDDLEEKEDPDERLFDPLVSNLRESLADEALVGFLISSEYSLLVQLEHFVKTAKVTKESFKQLRTLGRGAFGQVFAVQKLDTEMMYAAKVMYKRKVKYDKAEWTCQREHETLKRLDSPFCLGLKYAFQDADELVVMVDMADGGDLGFHLENAPKKRFPEQQARFYAAELLLALEHVHSKGVLYRDLKPQNVLLTQEGHLKLSDFGLATPVETHRGDWHLAGTPGYWSPECLKREPQGPASDYWSLGVVLFEFLVGGIPRVEANTARGEWSPFCDDDLCEKNAVSSQGVLVHNIDWSSYKLSKRAVSLLRRLMDPDPEARMSDPDEIRRHPFFSEIHWTRLSLRELQPPFAPSDDVHARSLAEIGQMDDESKRRPWRKVKLSPTDQAIWDEWDFVNEKSLRAELFRVLKDGGKLLDKNQSGADRSKSGCCAIL